MAYLVPFFFILLYYILAYARYPSIHLPIGWDTPWYINAINFAKVGNFLHLLQISYYTNFLYPLLFSFLPLNAFQIETYVPVILNLLLPIIVYFLVKRTSTYNAYVAMALTSAWFVTYRLPGLHSNLFSLILCLLASGIFLGINSLTNKKMILALTLLVISSFVGFEVTVFFVIVLFLTLLLSRSKTKNKYYLLITSIIPASLLYLYSKISRLQIEGSLATGSGAINFEVFLFSFGFFLIPLVIIGAYLIISKKDRSPYDYFSLAWVLPIILLVSLNFLLPIKNFAERSLILFPSIFLVLPAIDKIIKNRHTLEKKLFRPMVGIVIGSLIITACFTASFSYGMYPKQFLSKDIYNELEYLHGYLEQTNSSAIIMYNIINPGVVELYANWVQAIDGNVLQYYGSITDLLSLSEGYDNAISKRLYSQGGFDQMNFSTLIKCKLVILEQFYDGDISPSLQNYSTEIYKGITVVDLTSLSAIPSFTASTFGLWAHLSYGPWYYSKDTRTYDIYSNDTQNPHIFLNLNLPTSGVYNVTLCYWDGSENIGLYIYINDNTRREIAYSNIDNFTNHSISNTTLNSINTVKIEAFRKSPKSMYFAKLKSITISPNPWSTK
jgi:hypothetical protein